MRQAFRTVLRRRGVYGASAGILALGLGMSIAMFSLVDAVLMRPLPFPDQQAIQVVWKTDPLAPGAEVGELAYPELGDLQSALPRLQFVALMPTSLYGYARVLQARSGERVQIEGAPVSHDFFRVLGSPPILGRDFAASDEHVGAAPVVIISDRVWREQFGGDRNIVGRSVRLNGKAHEVIGVLGPGVEFPRGAGLWFPLGVDPPIVERRGTTFLQAIARTQPGYTREQMSRDVDALFARQAVEHPDVYSRSQRAVVTPLIEYWTGSARVHLWTMLGASLLLFVAATISSASLLLSRAMLRQTEIATRLALGAGRRQILAQLGAEGAVVATAAVLLGFAIAKSVVWCLTRGASTDIPRLTEAGLDWQALCFGAGAAFAAAMACSFLPAWSLLWVHLESTLREGGTRLSMSGRALRVRKVFLLAQTAVTVTLLGLAALVLLSYRSMVRADTGFANRGAVTMNLVLREDALPPGQSLTPQVRRALYDRLLTRLRNSPGITSAAAILLRPLEGTIGWDVPYEFEFEVGNGRDRKVLPKANYEVVTPQYFRTVGTALLEGRDFNRQDTESSDKVVIVNRSLAQRIRSSGHEPLQYPVRLGLGGWARVVGVCADARYRGVTQPGNDLYVPDTQANPRTNYVVIAGSRSPAQMTALVRRALAEMAPTQTIAGVATIGELIDANSARQRFNVMVLLWFGICAAILAGTGVYCAVAETLAARRYEMAIKMALGSQRGRLIKEMVSGTLWFVLAGDAVGLGCTTVVGSMASNLLYGVSAGDPLVLGAVGTGLLAVALAASIWPAWISAGIEPIRTLRSA